MPFYLEMSKNITKQRDIYIYIYIYIYINTHIYIVVFLIILEI